MKVEKDEHKPPTKSPNTRNKFHQKQTTKHQPSNPQPLPHIIPLRIRIPLITLIQIYDYVCEDTEEIEGDETENCVVLGARGEEGFDAGAADVVDFGPAG
jgi:hypothetical protein